MRTFSLLICDFGATKLRRLTPSLSQALAQGVDIIIAQGGEGGGHTGDTPTSILIPACAEEIKGKKSPLTGKPILLVAAGGIYNGSVAFFRHSSEDMTHPCCL